MKVDSNLIEEFFDYFKNTPIPNPDQYPIQFQFLVDSFVHYKKMQKGTGVENIQ
jgi:hypothetical protein